ncbi:MAG: UPF0175 family protein [Bacteroidales bacterium]|jgi:predicted HTH domain antitoxin|nr:UPF0175 family protein [Bacteroidales bacterium]
MTATSENYTVSYPASLAWTLKMRKQEFEKEMRLLSIIKLFELGQISSGKAASLLGISKIEFTNMLGKYCVSYIQTTEDELIEDFQNA